MIEAPAAEPIGGTDPMIPSPVMIRRITWETDDTFTLMLDLSGLENNGRPYAFSPGQFNMLYVFGVGESAISVSSDPAKPLQLAHTIHRVGAVTGALAGVKRGYTIGFRGPYGSPWPIHVAQQKDVCIIAGGIGLAPLRPLIYYLFRNRAEYGRIIILYGARSPLDLLYRVELEEWGAKNDAEVIVTVDRGDSSWKGYIGVVTTLFSYIKLDARNTVAYLCGPETMMKFTLEELDRCGIPREQTYLSMERNMKCAVGYCGHCQYGPMFICKDGPVFALPDIQPFLERKEL